MVGDGSIEILKLEGTLQGPWVDETHDAHALCAAATSRICLDLSGLTFADEARATLLRELIEAERVARRIAFRARECRARFRTANTISDAKDVLPGSVSEASRSELRLHLHAAVNGLPAKYRLLVVHTYMEGKSNAQVARLLRCPVGTVKGRLSRARDLLRARLCQRGWDQDDVRYRWG
jgi:RNA polymerase sigma factor (sigma-70 family)